MSADLSPQICCTTNNAVLTLSCHAELCCRHSCCLFQPKLAAMSMSSAIAVQSIEHISMTGPWCVCCDLPNMPAAVDTHCVRMTFADDESAALDAWNKYQGRTKAKTTVIDLQHSNAYNLSQVACNTDKSSAFKLSNTCRWPADHQASSAFDHILSCSCILQLICSGTVRL